MKRGMERLALLLVASGLTDKEIVQLLRSAEKYGRVWGVLPTSSRASVVVGTLVLGGLLKVLSWQMVPVCSGVVSVLLLFLSFWFLQNKPSDPDFLVADEEGKEKSEAHVALEHKLHHPLAGTTLPEGLLAFAKSYRCG